VLDTKSLGKLVPEMVMLSAPIKFKVDAVAGSILVMVQSMDTLSTDALFGIIPFTDVKMT
jgi:hypothetical protein